MSSKFNFDKYDEYLKNNNKEEKEVDVMENNEVKPESNLHTEMDMLEKRIYGFMKPYLKKIDFIDNNVQKLALDKEVSGTIKDLKKKGYTFENEDEILEQLEVDYLRGLGFKFNKVEVK